MSWPRSLSKAAHNNSNSTASQHVFRIAGTISCIVTSWHDNTMVTISNGENIAVQAKQDEVIQAPAASAIRNDFQRVGSSGVCRSE